MNDINELDVDDIGLKRIFGDRFVDETGEEKEDVFTPCHESNTVRWSEPQKPRDAQWEPVKAEPSTMQKLMNTAKWTCLFGGLSLLFFWWQQTGQMMPSAAVPSMCACTCMVGWSIGKNMVGGITK